MSFGDYKTYSLAELKQIFKLTVLTNANLFSDFQAGGKPYTDLQIAIGKMKSRISLSKSDNEATRRSLLVSRILWEASDVYKLGLFFEPQVELEPKITPDFPHALNGKYDCALSLDEIDLINPIIAVVEVKKSSLSEGLGQCIAEMYATLKKFEQVKVYGLITDGEIWSFLLLEEKSREGNQLSVNEGHFYINRVADIVDRIGYIAETFKVT